MKYTDERRRIMNIEDSIKDVIKTKLSEGIVEKLVAENLEKGINKSLENLLGNYGDVTKVIKSKIKEVLIKQLSSYYYSKYIVKLDCVLTEILQRTSLDNKKILENFKELIVDGEFPKIVKVSDIFEEFKKYVAEDVDISELEVCTDDDDEPSYEHVNVTMEIEREESRKWGSFKYAKIVLECENDEELNHEIRLSKFEEDPWSFDDKLNSSIDSLRYLDTFKLYLLKLQQSGAKIEIDFENLGDEVKPDTKPEVTFN